MDSRRPSVIVLGAAGAVATAAIVVQNKGAATGGRDAPGGILVGDAPHVRRGHSTRARLVLSRRRRRRRLDRPDRARVLEVGCGPGHLSNRLARRYGFDVTGVDLDPATIERARTNADRLRDAGGPRPSFFVADVTALAFRRVVRPGRQHAVDAPLATPRAGLAEIGRVLRPGRRALVWDFRPGVWPHAHLPEPVEHTHGSPLRLASATPWRWPWWFALTHRVELVR